MRRYRLVAIGGMVVCSAAAAWLLADRHTRRSLQQVRQVVTEPAAQPPTRAFGPPPKMVAMGTGADGTRDRAVLKPTRELVFEDGKAPASILFSAKRGVAYVACLGARVGEIDWTQLTQAEVIAVNAETGESLARLPFEELGAIALSSDERYLAVVSVQPKPPFNTTLNLYRTDDLSRKVTAMPLPRGVACSVVRVDKGGTVYIANALGNLLHRVAKGGAQTAELDRVQLSPLPWVEDPKLFPSVSLTPGDLCLGIDDRVLYVAAADLSQWQTDQSDGEPAESGWAGILVVNPRTLKMIQSVPLEGSGLGLWRNERSLVCVHGDRVDTLPMADDGHLLAPRKGPPSPRIFGGPLFIDETRSLGYVPAWAGAARKSWVIQVLDLRAQRLVGSVPVEGQYWINPEFGFSPATDEVWVGTWSQDHVFIYDLDEVIKRAHAEGETSL